VKPCDVDSFARTWTRLQVKCLHIVMPDGTAQAEQPMTGSCHLGTLSQAREQVLELARARRAAQEPRARVRGVRLGAAHRRRVDGSALFDEALCHLHDGELRPMSVLRGSLLTALWVRGVHAAFESSRNASSTFTA